MRESHSWSKVLEGKRMDRRSYLNLVFGFMGIGTLLSLRNTLKVIAGTDLQLGAVEGTNGAGSGYDEMKRSPT